MAYCILRTKKLKGFGAVISSARHTFREEPTPNADPQRSHKNRYTGAKTSAGVLSALRELLPARRRKDAVLAIEYLVTASPEFFKNTGTDLLHTRAGFFNAALEFLRLKHGKTNVISVALHLDEKTPHLVAYVVPINASGKLCAKDFLGGKDKLMRLQSDFFEQVGSKFGLERGVQGSRATHQAVQRFYTQINHPPALKSLSAFDKIAGLVGITTQAAAEREKDESALLSHSTAHAKVTLLQAKAAQRKAQSALEAANKRSEYLSAQLEFVQKNMAQVEIELQHAKENITTVEHHANTLYERNQLLQSSHYPSVSATNSKEKHVPKDGKSRLAP